ncbi:hypothetical protein [Vibrio sp. WXL210]|uniref:hypothetical protein n=1 Tax=Vibrio sp. WXL210 TaxID=3450709 RepID=UPI003EC7F328
MIHEFQSVGYGSLIRSKEGNIIYTTTYDLARVKMHYDGGEFNDVHENIKKNLRTFTAISYFDVKRHTGFEPTPLNFTGHLADFESEKESVKFNAFSEGQEFPPAMPVCNVLKGKDLQHIYEVEKFKGKTKPITAYVIPEELITAVAFRCIPDGVAINTITMRVLEELRAARNQFYLMIDDGVESITMADVNALKASGVDDLEMCRSVWSMLNGLINTYVSFKNMEHHTQLKIELANRLNLRCVGFKAKTIRSKWKAKIGKQPTTRTMISKLDEYMGTNTLRWIHAASFKAFEDVMVSSIEEGRKLTTSEVYSIFNNAMSIIPKEDCLAGWYDTALEKFSKGEPIGDGLWGC